MTIGGTGRNSETVAATTDVRVRVRDRRERGSASSDRGPSGTGL